MPNDGRLTTGSRSLRRPKALRPEARSYDHGMRERSSIKIRGIVQGVFFRETVRRIASRYDICGFVRNLGSDAVEIEAEGERDTLDAFIADVLAHPPPAARIEGVQSTAVAAIGGEGFIVRHWER